MPNIALLSDAEARHLAATGALFVVRPVVPQPRPLGENSWTWEWFEYYLSDDAMAKRLLKAPSPLGAPGDVLVCKEAWLHTGLGYKYRVSDPQWGKTCHWRPASTMPAWAVRFRPVVCEAGVMRVGDIPGKDAEAMGLDVAAKLPAFPPMGVDIDALVDMVGKQVLAAYWNRRFRKYPWEDNPWVWTAVVETPEKAARDEWAQREADKRRAMLEDMWWEEQNA